MRVAGFLKTGFFLLAISLTLSACKSSQERAEEYYQSGLELINAGDYDRGIVELRNVFEFDGSHRDARFLLATTLLEERDNPRGAYSQFLRLAEQYPEDVQTRIALSEIAFEATNWEELERHGEVATDLAPDDPRAKAIAIALAYREAVLAKDDAARREQARAAKTLQTQLPDSVMLRKLVLDNMLSSGELSQALVELGWLLERNPNNILYWRQRLNILAQQNDMEGVEAQLLEMLDRFPEDLENKKMLLRYYISRGDTDKAESFLRRLSDAAETNDSGPRVDLVNYLLQTKGSEAALAEVDKAIVAVDDPLLLQTIRAGILFSEGQENEAVAYLSDILEQAEPSEQARDSKVALARMLLSLGNEVGARAQVEQVLAEDEEHPMALKMQASWQIRADETEEAINSLRTALDRTPDDAQAMTLMAEAYERSGRPELSQDFLALAAEASGNAPQESLRYAQLLISQERYLPAEDVLIASLRLDPQNIQLLSALGGLYFRMDDLARAEQVINTLRNLEGTQAQQASHQLEAQLISLRNGVDDAIAYLEGVASGDDATLASQVELVRVRLATGDAEGALDLVRKLLAENPENLSLKAIIASVEAANGNVDTAISTYREVVEEQPDASNVWLQLARLIQRENGADAANEIINEALAISPDNANLLWASASYKEQSGDLDGAIEIYEALYARDSGSVVIANNLASMLSTYRQDKDSLDRAWAVARRFRDTDIPAMQDTFGWILHRRDESKEAVTYLEAAAQGLPNDPLVQFHLGKVYEALARPDDALAQFRKTVQIAGPEDMRAQIVEARNSVEAAAN